MLERAVKACPREEKLWLMGAKLGSAPTTYFYGRVGSLSQKVRKFLVVSGRVWSYFGRVFGRFLVALQNEILKEKWYILMAFMASFFYCAIQDSP